MPLLEYFNTIAKRTAEKDFSAPLIIEEQFKRVATYVINNLSSDAVLNELKDQQEVEHVFTRFVIQSLENKKESIKESMSSILNSIRNSISYFDKTKELQEQLKQVDQQYKLVNKELSRIKTQYQDNAEKLKALKEFLKNILRDEQNKQLILEEMWKEYSFAQKKHLWDGSWISFLDRKLQEDGCFSAQFGQAQANEFERVGMGLFAIGFTLLDRACYRLFGGKIKLNIDPDSKLNCDQPEKDHNNNKSDNNSFNRLRKVTTGNPFSA